MKNRIIVLAVLFILSLVSLYSQVGQGNSRSLSMSELQPINVTIGGDFIAEGTFPASPNERVDQFVTRIYNESRNMILSAVKDQQTFLQLYSETTEFSKRGIKLVRSGDTVKVLDLMRFRLTGDFDNNPYLQNDDVLIFPVLDLEKNSVEVAGAVKNPTKFQYVEGDKISDAILFAGGIDKTYKNVNQATISRLSQDGLTENLIVVDLNDDFVLKPGDRVKLVGEPSFKEGYNVLVLGEVNNPGIVFIPKNGEKLYNIVKKIGGFRKTAYLEHAEVIRDEFVNHSFWKDYLKEKFLAEPSSRTGEETTTYLSYIRNYERLSMLRNAYLIREDSVNFFIDNELRLNDNRSKLDFNELDDPNSQASNYIVKNNDVIIVPEKPDYVYIFGQVAEAGYYNYEPNKSLEEYLLEAGGITEHAQDDVFLIKAKSREWINLTENRNAQIEPGDYIYILKEIPRSFWYYAAQVNTITSIVGSIATVVLLLNQFGK